VALLADDDVVMHYNAEIFGRRHDLLGYLDIDSGGRGIACGVIVHDHDRCGRQLEPTLHHLAHIDPCVIDGALLPQLIRDDLIALVEEAGCRAYSATARLSLISVMAASPKPGTSRRRFSGAFSASAKVPKTGRESLGEGLRVAARHRAERAAR
jgi:hypothetical protein